MKLSYVIVTHNRRATLLRTLAILHAATPLPSEQWECLVVDQGSTDGTAEGVGRSFPGARLIRLRQGEAPAARNHGIFAARGRFLVLLDDDTHPVDDAVVRSIDHLEAERSTAGVVGRCELPDGSHEAGDLPTVMCWGAACLRRSVFDDIGGFDAALARGGGDEDLSFRVWEQGWRIERFEDIVYRRDPATPRRATARDHRMALRNRLILCERYFPQPLRRYYREDWTQRGAALAEHARFAGAARLARIEARAWACREAIAGRQLLNMATLDIMLHLSEQQQLVRDWARDHRVRRVLVADFGPNLFATALACRAAQLKIIAIADNHPAFDGLNYRGVPIASDDALAHHHPDGIVLSTINPGQIERRVSQLRDRFSVPVLRLWRPALMPGAGGLETPPLRRLEPAASRQAAG